MLGALNRKFGWHVWAQVLKNVYSACIRAILDYGSVIYDPVLKQDISELERFKSSLYDLYYGTSLFHMRMR